MYYYPYPLVPTPGSMLVFRRNKFKTSSKMFLVNSNFSSMDWVINKQREQQSTVCKHIRHSRAFPAVVQGTVGWPFWPTVSRRNSDEMKWDCTEKTVATVGGRKPFLCRTVYSGDPVSYSIVH